MILIIKDLLEFIIDHRSMVDRRVKKEADIEIHASDVSAKDKNELANAGNDITSMILYIFEKEMIE
jgi:hypothetical protein